MSEPKFTPGPWHVENGTQIVSDDGMVASAWIRHDGAEGANAQLIAAVPAFAEALYRAVLAS